MSNIKFATAINCIDGRIQIPVIEWIRKEYGISYVDMVTEPGPNKILAKSKDSSVLNSIKRRVKISVDKHGSKLVAIVGHYDCAGNPVDRETHIKQLKEAMDVLKLWFPDLKIIGLWINQNWEVEEVK